ncbi:MAG: TldD/PmbA family protein, partial [Halanaerobiaceae bacterium]
MKNKDVLKYCIDSLTEKGIDKAQCCLVESKKHEINADSGEISLLRTTLDTDLNITGIKNRRKGDISLNNTDKESLAGAVSNINDLINTSEVDEAYDIAAGPVKKEFSSGLDKPDLDRMYQLLDGFVKDTKNLYPDISLEQIVFQFNIREKCLQKSNDVDLSSSKGIYSFSAMFSAKNEEKTTSFNHTSFSLDNLEKSLMQCGSV